MNKEIYYRFWNPYTKIMIGPLSLYEIQSSMIAAQCFDHAMLRSSTKDMHGKYIFDGDVILSDDGFDLVVFGGVSFEVDGFMFESESFSVVGNKYETPELLKVQA